MAMLARLKRALANGVRRESTTITAAQLTAAAGSQEFEFAGVPADAIVLGYKVDITIAFTDGAAGAFTLDLGDGTTADSIADGLDLSSIAKLVAAAALSVLISTAKLSATVLADVNVGTATAGAMKVTVFYIV